MTVVSNILKSPNGQPIKRAYVSVRLAPPVSGDAHGYETAEGFAVHGPWETRTDDTGLWSLDLIANSRLTPANSYYEVSESIAGSRVVSAIVVPISTDPSWLFDLLALPPEALPQPAAFLSDIDPLPLAHLADEGAVPKAPKQDHSHPFTGVGREATPGIVGSEVTSLSLSSYWGLRDDLTAYYDPAGADPDEAAFLQLADDGTFVLIRPE